MRYLIKSSYSTVHDDRATSLKLEDDQTYYMINSYIIDMKMAAYNFFQTRIEVTMEQNNHLDGILGRKWRAVL